MLILAGGFVRYPFMPLVDFSRWVWKLTPAPVVRAFFKGYAIFARWRHRHAPETSAAIKEFVARRTPLDLAAMGHRLKLIRENNPTVVARQVAIPVCQLAGFWDPIVWQPAVKRWLQANCPGCHETCVIPFADHNVLGTAPDAAAQVVVKWINLSPRPSDRAG
jgi:pimeloyl-ACP methyl ester carboxylesterase